jgi:predicted nucleic acid-binding protein
MILDTDVLIWFLRGDSAAVRLIESQSDRAASIVSVMELVRGA